MFVGSEFNFVLSIGGNFLVKILGNDGMWWFLGYFCKNKSYRFYFFLYIGFVISLGLVNFEFNLKEEFIYLIYINICFFLFRYIYILIFFVCGINSRV